MKFTNHSAACKVIQIIIIIAINKSAQIVLLLLILQLFFEGIYLYFYLSKYF